MSEQSKSPADILTFPKTVEPETPSRFTFEDFDHVEPSRQPWLVKGILPRNGIAFVAGPSMSLKTFMLLSCCVQIAKGEPVFGRKTERCAVIYIGSEDPGGLRLRMKGLRRETGSLGAGWLHLVPQSPNLTDPADVEALQQALIDKKAEIERDGRRLGVVVIDTLAASIPGADENAASGMSPVLSALKTMGDELDCLVWCAAHIGHNGQNQLRGWSGLGSNADSTIFLEEPIDSADPDFYKNGCGIIKKVKNEVGNIAFTFPVKRVELGVDEDGAPITTLVALTDEMEAGVARSATRKRNAKPNPQAGLVSTAINYLIDNGQTVSVPPLPGLPSWAKAVSADALRERLKIIGFAGGDWTISNTRTLYARARDWLQDEGHIRIEGSAIIWLGKRD